MKTTARIAARLVALVGQIALIGSCRPAHTQEFVQPTRVRVAIHQGLLPMDGARIKVTTVEVDYAPGDSSHPHKHPCPVIGYVVEGAVRSGGESGADSVYQAGETFYEAANTVHTVSANASKSQRARFLATFICDREGPLSVDVDPSL